jgi:hypothetical protein
MLGTFFKFGTIVSIALGLQCQNSFGYALVHGKDSALPKVNFYVFKNQRHYEKLLLAQGIPSGVLKFATSATGFIELTGEMLGPATDGGSIVVAEGITLGIKVSNILYNIFKSPIQSLIRMGFTEAYHSNVLSGSHGDRARWNWKSILKQHADDHGTLYIVATDPKTHLPLYQGTISIAEKFGFTVVHEKTADGQVALRGIVSSEAASEYLPAR